LRMSHFLLYETCDLSLKPKINVTKLAEISLDVIFA
jgi:hypothetical protein